MPAADRSEGDWTAAGDEKASDGHTTCVEETSRAAPDQAARPAAYTTSNRGFRRFLEMTLTALGVARPALRSNGGGRTGRR